MLALSPRLKLRYLPAKPRDILTSINQLIVERTLFPLIRNLGKFILTCPSPDLISDGLHCQDNPDACPARVRDPRATHTLRGHTDSQHQVRSKYLSDDVVPPPPHPMVDTCGGHRLLVESRLNHCDIKGVGRVTPSGGTAIRPRRIVESLARN